MGLVKIANIIIMTLLPLSQSYSGIKYCIFLKFTHISHQLKVDSKVHIAQANVSLEVFINENSSLKSVFFD